MGRKILFITTDQQRYDSLGCNGNMFCRTPNIDALAKNGAPDPYHGHKLRYVNPASGDFAMPTIATFVQLLPGSPVTQEELMSFTRFQLTSYKRPSEIIILDVLPALPAQMLTFDKSAS